MTDFPDDEASLLASNDPASDYWDEDSVLGRLMEEGLLDQDGYAELEAALIEAASAGPHFETLGVAVRIAECFTRMVRRHVDPDDTYGMANLDDEQVAQLDARVRFWLLEISLGAVPDMSRWES